MFEFFYETINDQLDCFITKTVSVPHLFLLVYYVEYLFSIAGKIFLPIRCSGDKNETDDKTFSEI